MTEQHSIAEARQNLPTLVRSAENGAAIELTRRGKPVAVLIGQREFVRLSSGGTRFSEAWRRFAQDVDLAELTLDPDELFREARPKEAGRDVHL